MRRAALIAGAVVAAGLISAPISVADTRCTPTTTRHLTTITVTHLCPPRVRVELARPVVIVNVGGEIPIVRHDVPVDFDRARRGRVTFEGIDLGIQYEWRSISGRHRSPWTIVNV